MRGNYTPVPQVAATPTTGLAPLTVTFSSAGTATPTGTRKVTDSTGRSVSDSVEIVVGNQVPQVRFITPTAGQTFNWGDRIQYEVEVTDDQEIDCSRVTVSYLLGHDTHSHPISETTGCTGSLVAQIGDHGGETNLFAVFGAEYEDDGFEGEGSLTGTAEVVLQPAG